MFLKRFLKITDKSYLNALSQAGVIGMHMVSGIAVGTVAGYLLDRWLETSPWFTLVFMVVGIIAGFKNVYLDTKLLLKKQREEDDKKFSSQAQADARADSHSGGHNADGTGQAEKPRAAAQSSIDAKP